VWKFSRDDLTGSVLDDRYRLGKRIGDGSMGSVYRAEHIHLGTSVAVKVLHSRFEKGSGAEQRFLREGQSAGRIDHPNVVRIFDVGRSPDGAPYIVMELLEGQELSKLLAAERLTLARVATLASQLLSGLARAHAERVVHRDIKPDNLFLTREDNAELLKILDFSIAKDQGAAAMTCDGDVLGTAHYLAPEQAMGKPIDARVDLWSVGVVAYEMLTGRPPFEGDTFPALMMKILGDMPAPPSASVTGVPPEIDAFFERALAKEPAERFQDAASMRMALADAFAHGNVPLETTDDLPIEIVTVVDRLDLDDTLLD